MPEEPIWHYYEYEQPQQDLPIIIETRWKSIKPYESVVFAKDFPPESNVSGLRWRPTGIFKEFKGTITQYGIQQANINQSLYGSLLSNMIGGQAGSLLSDFGYAENDRRNK